MAIDPNRQIFQQIMMGLYDMAFPHGVISNIGGVPFLQPGPGNSPAVTGTATVGQTLSVSNGVWNESPTSFTYQWENEGVPIGGATNNNYTQVLTDLGCTIDCQVTAHNAVGASLPARSNLYGPVISTTAFYVSSSGGSDANAGTSPGAAWKTLAHVSAYSTSPGFPAGSSLLFKRGDTWDWTSDPSGPVIFWANSGQSSVTGLGPIVLDAYGSGANPIIDGSITGFPTNSTNDWAATGTANVWQSAATFGTSGLPYFGATDVGNILWNFSPIGGTAPAQVMTASFGTMKGAGTGGVWFKPGEGQTSLANTSLGTWNFNTDNGRVQIYSVGNPFNTMSGLRLVLDSGFMVFSNGNQYVTIQNLTIQNAGASNMVKTLGNYITVRDCIFQWIGGANIGGQSNSGSRAGDGFNQEQTYTTHLIERCYFYQMYDIGIAPQLYTAGSHDNLTIRNNIFNHFSQAIWMEMGSTGSQAGLFIYNNTAYGVNSWSWNQRPNGGNATWGLTFDSPASGLSLSNWNIENNVFAGIVTYGILIHPNLTYSFSGVTSPMVIDYNNWKLTTSSPALIAQTSNGTQINMIGPSPGWQAVYGFEAHGLIDQDPSFKSAPSDFTPTASSPLRNAGVNLFNVANTVPPNAAVGVVWDFFKNPRPSAGNFTMGAIQG